MEVCSRVGDVRKRSHQSAIFFFAIRLLPIGNRIATTELVWNHPVVYNRIALKKEGRAPEAPNDAPDESVTELFASARIRLLAKYIWADALLNESAHASDNRIPEVKHMPSLQKNLPK